MNAPAITRHSALEDVLAIVTGTLFVSLGITLFKQGGLLSEIGRASCRERVSSPV